MEKGRKRNREEEEGEGKAINIDGKEKKNNSK